MSKSGNYNLGEIEKRDMLINELFDACQQAKEFIEKEYRETNPMTGLYIEKVASGLWDKLCDAMALVETDLPTRDTE